MPIAIQSSRARRRVIVVAPPDTRWRDFQELVRAAVQETPELTDWNWIIDDQGPMDDVDVAEMAATGEAFRRLAAAPERRTYTVVVTRDRHFPTWARVIDLNYGNRMHHPAPTLEAASALLDRLEAGPADSGWKRTTDGAQ